MCAGPIGSVGVQTSGNRQPCYPKGSATSGHLDGLQIPHLDRSPYEGVDLREDLRCEDLFEAPFFTTSCEVAAACASRASHSRSLVSTSSFTIARNRLYSAIWARVASTAWGRISLVTVLPPTSRVSDQTGPWPRAPGRAQWQLGLPQTR